MTSSNIWQSGRNGRSHADGPMAEVVVNSTSQMSDADVRAIAVYLKDLPAGAPEPAVTPPPQDEMTAGEAVYAHACVACHEADGTGAPRIYPPLPGNANLQSADPSSTLRIILDGAQTVTTPRAPNTGSMPAYAKQLSDQEIADVTNYIRNSWGNAAPLVTPAQVAEGAADEVTSGVPSTSANCMARDRHRRNPEVLDWAACNCADPGALRSTRNDDALRSSLPRPQKHCLESGTRRRLRRLSWALTEEPIHGQRTQSERSLSRPIDPYRSQSFRDDEYRGALPASTMNCSPIPNSPKVPPAAAGLRCSRSPSRVVLGAVFYGLNNSSINQAGTSSTAQNTSRRSPPAAPPGMRDVTPRANTAPGDDHRRGSGAAADAAGHGSGPDEPARQSAGQQLRRASKVTARGPD